MNKQTREMMLMVTLEALMRKASKGEPLDADFMAARLEDIAGWALPKNEQLKALAATNKAERAVRHMMEKQAFEAKYGRLEAGEGSPRPTA